jgi:diguanylate cyclase (GGDEF)-like protein/PAS domain S-box-containing protein
MTVVREPSAQSAASSVLPPRQVQPTPIVAPDVHARLLEAEETLRAIRSGEVDALVVHDASPDAQVFTLASADRPYRRFVENMRDGAATLSESGIVLYANRSLAALLRRPLTELIGSRITSLIADDGIAALQAISGRSGGTTDVDLISSDGDRVPVRLNTSALDVDAHFVLCLTFADLTQQNAHKLEIDRLRAVRMRELEQAQDALTQQATHDALTGLANRTLLVDRIVQALAVAERSQDCIGLIFVDLDGFKEINDTRGHAAGDSVLRQIAGRLERAVRPMDSVSRLGGDEFVVLMPALASAQDALNVAERIVSEVDLPIKLGHGSVAVSASIGISIADPASLGPDRSAERLLQQADTAMYHAKSLGGAKTQLFETGITPTVFEADRETWVTRIHEALEEDRFVLHSQPIVDLATGATVRHELLLSLRERDGRLIAPTAFLPTAERCGLIGHIDRWVIGQAARIAGGGQPISVNLSAASAADPLVLDLIERELIRHEIDPGNIMFEITETAVMQNIDRGRLFAERMVALGCSFALDDFGTGFASLTYLKHLPVQYLKIDIEFVRDLAQGQRDQSVVSAIVALARGFGQQTIAEGVENEETAAVLRDLGVTFAQGYLFGAPTPLSVGIPLAGALSTP